MTYCIEITRESDIADAVRESRRLATSLGFGTSQALYVATAAAELATNLYIHAGGGAFQASQTKDIPGIELVARDKGPGIADLELAFTEGYSTAGGLGCGLSGISRLMDQIDVSTRVGEGTVIKAYKWL